MCIGGGGPAGGLWWWCVGGGGCAFECNVEPLPNFLRGKLAPRYEIGLFRQLQGATVAESHGADADSDAAAYHP